MRKTALLLVLCILFSLFSACTFKIPSISEAKKVIDAYVYYNQTGDVPSNIDEVIGDTQVNNNGSSSNVNSSSDSGGNCSGSSNSNNNSNNNGEPTASLQDIINDTPKEILADTLKETTKPDILSLAEHYYNLSYPNIEPDTKTEYDRLITWKPDFNGKKSTEQEISLQKHSSINVALALSYTSAKNFYLAMAAAVLSINPEDITAAGNFAAALAAYADDSASGNTLGNSVSQLYNDAEKVYHYALLRAGGEQYSQEALPVLVSLGNLYLDNGRYGEAYGCFQSAREINDEYYPAVEGLYNTYMVLKEYKKALELLAETTKYPAFISASRKVSEKTEEDIKKPGINESSADEERLKQTCDSLNTIDSISVADYLGEFDGEAKEKLNKLIKQVEGKMVYKAPDIILISQYSSVKAISSPLGESALEAFSYGLDQLQEKADDLQYKVISKEISEEAAEKAAALAMQYQKDNQYDTLKMFYEAFSAIFPEFSVFTLNPFEYENPVDIVVQRYNINMFNTKHITYSGYLGVVNSKVIKQVEDIINNCYDKVDELWEEMNDALSKLPEDASESDAHRIHAKYYPQINNIEAVSWHQATQAAASAYQQKIKGKAEQMYNDCMKHVILISDDVTRRNIEDKLQATLLSNLSVALTEVYRSHSFVSGVKECGCNHEALRAKQEREEKERERLANQQILKNMEAKKRFEAGELDENSEYYKKIIAPYETKINTPFVQGVVGPYKSGFKVKIDIPGVPPVIEFGKMENHIRNTTSYNGGIEVGAGPIKTYLKFSATKGSNGQFSADDVDIIGGGEMSFSKACSQITVGMEASALRGTKAFANYQVSGDDFLNEELKSYLGDWAPNLTKTLWEGEYPLH
ncbi:MAG: tetratricopeptide repeat protein [Ruminiclostridium sp.]|nr:tetratricopeptide repeat protein [Ruminiclostridium sp.]